MKKCLITGAAGLVGLKLISKLLIDGNYEITALDLKSPKAVKRLNQYKDRINIIYADINDEVIMKALIKEHDYIFHLAGILPQIGEIHPNLTKIIDYQGSIKLIDWIKEINPKAYLFYISTTSLYGKVNEVEKESKVNIKKNDYYSKYKLEVENYLKENLKNYVIYRTPLILEKDNLDCIIYNMPYNMPLEVITNTLVAKALAATLKNLKKLNKKTYILTGGEKYRTTSSEIFINVLKIKGISGKYLLRYFGEKNFYGHYYNDNTLNEILDFQKGDIDEVYASYEKEKLFRRFINRFFAYFIIRKLKK